MYSGIRRDATPPGLSDADEREVALRHLVRARRGGAGRDHVGVEGDFRNQALVRVADKRQHRLQRAAERTVVGRVQREHQLRRLVGIEDAAEERLDLGACRIVRDGLDVRGVGLRASC